MSRLDRLADALAGRRPRIVDEPARVPAAVAVVLVPDPDAILLIRRAERAGDRWSGQMAFPGGRWSNGDADLRSTAVRETAEETGVDLSDARLVGRLDDSAPRNPSLPPVVVSPFVFTLRGRQPLQPNEEVAGALWAPLDLLLSPGVYRPYTYEYQGAALQFPGYHLKDGVVWGMTERILTPLLELMGTDR